MTFKRALETVQDRLRPQSPLTLARCLFNAGEAKRQAGDLATARAYLDEAANVISAERTAGEQTTCTMEVDGGDRFSLSVSPAQSTSSLQLIVAGFSHPVLW